MYEVYVLVAKKKSIILNLVACLFLVLAIATALMMCRFGIYTMIIVSLLCLTGWFFFQFRMNAEYEYSYFDGEVRFAKIMNKSRRRKLKTYVMDDVVVIAPAGDQRVSQYESRNDIKVKNYTSHKAGEPYYVMVAKNQDMQELIKFEPDEKFLEAVCVKYASRVVRRPKSE